ncbi:marR family protein [Pseudarthrobacter siccitolerans]|uniref:MarR family protein n=1 Tax=Pseudarthrobacter siccitolerans TaxID=861266 RepID=A0A024GYF0_9MICC|nr:MarR family winged helix-turn-helix transcriptional regulator [Pseudarthrobacter siccitolerans]CCQ44496.1 marR family protein [Pseudarthrobacter siccitolerans]
MSKGLETSSLYPLFSELTRLETELWDAVDNRLRKEHGLPMSRFEPMAVVDRLGACRVFDVATALAITVGGTSKLIDRIEKAGHCRRRNNPLDRRSSLIELTADGRMLLERARKTVDAELDLRLNPVLSRQQTDDLMELLGVLRNASRLAAAGRPD